MSDTATQIVHDWIKSDACPLGVKMMLLPANIAPLIEAVRTELDKKNSKTFRRFSN